MRWRAVRSTAIGLKYELGAVCEEVAARALTMLSVILRERLPGIADEMDGEFGEKLQSLLFSFRPLFPTLVKKPVRSSLLGIGGWYWLARAGTGLSQRQPVMSGIYPERRLRRGSVTSGIEGQADVAQASQIVTHLGSRGTKFAAPL